MLPSSTSATESKRESLQYVVEKADRLEELVKLFSYIDISTTKAFLSSAIGELGSLNLNYAYFGVRNIEEILCRELLQHIISFLYVFERYKYAICCHTFYSIIYTQPPSSIDITHYETWISFDINNNVEHKHVSISDMLFLYSKQYPTYIKLNPLKLNSIHYLLNKLHLNIKNIKIGAMGISLINRILIKYESNENITHKLKEWLCNLESIAFVANDINTINLFLAQYKPKLMYLSMDSIRYNTTIYNNNHRLHAVSSNYAANTLHQYLSDEMNEGYDAPQPTPTPRATKSTKFGSKDGSSSCSSSLIAGNNTLSSDYSASDDDDGMNGFCVMNESSDGYHHEGHIQSHSNNKHRLFRASQMHPNNNYKRVHHHHHHHRYRNKHRKHNTIHNMMRNVSLTENNIYNNNVIEYDSVDALQIFSSYSEIRISSINYLMRNSIKYLGIDINIESQSELHKLQQIIYDKRLSPSLCHLSITDFKDLILIPNRIHSLVIQRWFNANLSNLYFESQFFPYNLSQNTNNYCYLSLNGLTKRLYALSMEDEDESADEHENVLNNESINEKRIDLQFIQPNTTSSLFEIKLLLNFDVMRNRWIILKEQYEFLLRLKCLSSLSVIHLVMLDQQQINKHCSQYYSVHGHRHHHQYKINHGNIHNLHGNNNSNTKKVPIYDFPPFHCKWHKNKEFHVIAPKKCCKNKVFRSPFPPQTQFYAFNPMIRDKHYNDDEWLLKKKLMQITDLFAVGLANQLQYPC